MPDTLEVEMTRLLLPSQPTRSSNRRTSSGNPSRYLEQFFLPMILLFALLSTLVISLRLLQEPTSVLLNNMGLHKKKDVSESMVVYDLRPGLPTPQFGDLIPDPIRSHEMFVARSNVLIHIDQVHRQGLYHTGTWQHVVDADHRLLLLQRGPQLVTCPNAWALPGEHTLGLEMPLETARRGMQEELGASILQHVEKYQLLTPDPVYYIREYGPQNANRVDRQIVYLWWIPLTVPASQVTLALDEEVANHQWISLPELEEKIRLVQQQQPSEHNNKEDGSVWYCDASLLRLYELGLAKLKEHLQAHDTKSR